MNNEIVSSWTIKQTKELEDWFSDLDNDAQIDILASVEVLSEFGPVLGRPQVDTLNGSQYPNMKELRVQSKGRPFRIAFAFDPNRAGILLIGGNKEGKKRFYDELIEKADEIYTRHLKELENEKPKEKKSKKSK